MDRQAVFRNDCASCHVAPTVGKQGAELFQAACAICHSAAHRAGMVPDLGIAREPRDAAYWRKWIREGKVGTLMPGFAVAHGGPLTEEQIESLIAFAMKSLPAQPGSN
jgi:mono/diheme cytochrome c family protein